MSCNLPQRNPLKIKAVILLFLCANLILCASTQQKTLKAREKDPQYQYNMGLFHLNNNNPEEAIKFFQRTIALDPRYYLAFNALGLAHSLKGDLQAASAFYQKCLQLNPAFTEARNNLGTLYQEMGFLDKAEQEFRKALEDANYASKELPYYNLARIFFLQKDHEKALGHLQMALRLNNRFAMAHNLKGLALESLDRFPEAIAAYEQAVKLVPDEVNFNFNLAVACFKNHEFQKAGQVFEKIVHQATDPEMKEKIASYLKLIKDREK